MRVATIATTTGASVALFAEVLGGFTIPEIVQATASGVMAALLTIIVVKLGPAAIDKFFTESKLVRDHDSVQRDSDRKHDETERSKQREHFDMTLKFLQERNSENRKAAELAMMVHVERLEKAIAVSIERAVQGVVYSGKERRKPDSRDERMEVPDES